MRFDENMHRRVIRELQRGRGVELKKIGQSRKYLIDGRGSRYVVLGGDDYRHEVPCSIFQAEEQGAGDTVLVVAALDQNNLDIFVGPFRPLVEHRNQLPIDKDHHVFHVHRFGGRLLVRELPSLELTRLEQEAFDHDRRAPKAVLKNLRRAKAIARARDKPPKSNNEDRARADQRVTAVEGNLIRADFRKKRPG